jgi:WD40-like Beta Propeller Repeat
MIDERDLIERAITALVEDEPSFEGLLRRRDRRQRNERIAAGIVAAIVVAAVVGASIVGYVRSSPKPVGLGPATPFRQDGEVLEHGPRGELEAVAPGTGASRVLIDSAVGDAAWSPDGTRLAYSVPCQTQRTQDPKPCLRPTSQAAGIWVRDASGAKVQLSSWYGSADWMSGDFAWSPDGTRIAYATPGLDSGLYIANGDGTQPTPVPGTEDLTVDQVPPSWSPDGTRLAYSISGPNDHNQVHLIQLDTGVRTDLVEEGRDPVWSPDGRHMAFVASAGIGVVNADGGDFTLVGKDGYEFAWSPDGTRIVYHVEYREQPSNDFHEELWVVSSDGAHRANILPVGCCPGGIVDEGFAWSPDGSRIAFIDAVYDGQVEDQWVLTRSDGSDADQALSHHDRMGLTGWLGWQPCLCTAGSYA